MRIGFIGQGWIGRHYADDFESRGFRTVRYALEAPYAANKDAIGTCDIVFIAVPTPTTPDGFDDAIVLSAMGLVGKGRIAVIKSTVLPGVTESVQKRHPDVVVLHSPEFLTEKTAAHDAAHPLRNIVGVPVRDATHEDAAKKVLSVLPKAPYVLVTDARTAELIKYGGNCFLYAKVVFMNMLYDLARATGADFDALANAMAHDPRIGSSHMRPVDAGGRGAGGHCFIKDFEAFRREYVARVGDPSGGELLRDMVRKNNAYLASSGKDADLLAGVYGKGGGML